MWQKGFWSAGFWLDGFWEGDKPGIVSEIEFVYVKPRTKKQTEEIEQLAKYLEGKTEEKRELVAEKKKVTRQKKQAKIRSPEYYELQTYEYLLTIQITQLEADTRNLEAELQALQSVLDRLAWQQEMSNQMAYQSMLETDMAFIITMLSEV